MVFTEGQKKQFVHTMSTWLSDLNVKYEKVPRSDTILFKLENHDFNIILDFLETPYPFGSLNNICLSIDYFIFREDALLSRLQSLFNQTKRIHARTTSVEHLDKPEAEVFFENNHLAGYVHGQHNYGLMLDGALVAAITFAKGRNIKMYERSLRSFEWIGYCSLNGHTVVGGMSKLISHFSGEKRVDHLATYIDRAWATAKSLKTMGFELAEELLPLPFQLDFNARKRVYPSRHERASGHINRDKYPFQNGGYLKFQQLYDSNH